MRILFFLQSLGRRRHFTNVVRGLVERGHTLVLARSDTGVEKEARAPQPGIEVVSCPVRRVDRWAPAVEPLRSARDRLRFFDDRYDGAFKLAHRAAKHAPRGLNEVLEQRPWLRRHWKRVQQALALAETVVPCDPGFRQFVQAQAPDLVLVTPLVEFGSYQTDYVKCAHTLGIPVAYLPFSWDNLTNRGLIRVAPDRVLVWNDHQRREAVEMHGMPSDRVIVTGAPRFDEFCAMTPSTPREQFCAPLRFAPDRPIVLYVCSAGFIAPQEVAFVRRWIAALRSAPGDSWLRGCNVLIRPHPANRDEWQAADLSDLTGVAVWATGSKMNADQTLFDSLFHAEAVVGLNTSAMIEAAIVGRPVYTITVPEFAGGQVGTLHFWYLLAANGGVVTVAEGFDAHLPQLAAAPRQREETADRSRRFVAHFVRPRGIDRPASDVMIEEIERAAALQKQPRADPAWQHPLRWGLDAALRHGLLRVLTKA